MSAQGKPTTDCGFLPLSVRNEPSEKKDVFELVREAQRALPKSELAVSRRQMRRCLDAIRCAMATTDAAAQGTALAEALDAAHYAGVLLDEVLECG